jgi:hypothetical protein
MGEAFMSLLRGRTAYTLSRVSRARRYKGSAREDMIESEVILREIEEDMDQLQARFEFELAKVQEKWADIASQVEEYRITPYKKDIHLEVFGVGWMPQHIMVLNNQPVTINAWEARRTDRVRQQESQYQGGPQFSQSTYGLPVDSPQSNDRAYDDRRGSYQGYDDRSAPRSDRNHDYDAGYQRDDYRQRGGYYDDPDRRY